MLSCVFFYSVYLFLKYVGMDDFSFSLLDDILKILADSYSKELTHLEIAKKLYPKYYTHNGSYPTRVDTIENEHNTIIEQSLLFLNSQGFLKYNSINKKASINVKGLIKIKTDSFVKQYKREKMNITLQRWTWIILPIAGFITATVSVINLFCDIQ